MSNDSLQKRKVFPEVIKEVQKSNVKGRMFIPISVISDSLLHQIRPQQVDEVLTMLPGIFIQNYGGFGGLKSVSIRGTNSSQSVMMIEGIRINTSQNGMIDLSTIPANFLQTIEVTRTGASALYGANAIGGAINFRLQNNHQKPSFTLHRSSFDSYSATSSFGFTSNNIVTNFSLNGVTSRGNYPFPHNEFGTTSLEQRENGDFHQFSGMVSSTYSPSLHSSLSTLIMTSSTERGVPGAVVQGSVEFKNARLKEKDFFISLIGKTSLFSTIQNESKIWLRSNSFFYTDPDATLLGANGLTAQYNGMDLGFQSTFIHPFDNNSNIESQVELISTTVEGLSLEDGETINPLRNTISFSSNYTSPVLYLLSLPFQFFTGLRYDYISDQNNALSPIFSLQMPFNEHVKVRTSYSYNYRPPTFNEMYYLNYGNQNLLSERSHSTTIGIEANVSSYFQISADLFSLHTTNLIVSVPTSPVSWSAQNIGIAENKGIEISSNFSLFDNLLIFNTNLTLQNVIDKSVNSFTYNLRIPYTPKVLSSAQLLTSFDNFSTGVTYTYSGNRFSLAGNQSETLLPFFHTLTSFVEFSKRLFPLLIHSRLQIDNLFDYSYTVIRNFPVPGRSFRLTMGITWL
jgi:outer membrane cobalamin receptor